MIKLCPNYSFNSFMQLDGKIDERNVSDSDLGDFLPNLYF